MTKQQRINKLAQQLTAVPTTNAQPASLFAAQTSKQTSTFGKVGVQSPDDVVIVSAVRTAVCKARKGAFRNTTPDDLLKAVLKGVLDQTKINPDMVNDVIVGNVQMNGSYSGPARTAQLRAGFSEKTALRSVNRQCSSGLQAIASIASEIATGMIDCGIGCGVESMTNGGKPGENMPPVNLNEIFTNKLAAEALTPMGVTSENVAEAYGVTRTEQDQLAVDSHAKAIRAIKEGRFAKEIIPVTVTVEDKDGNETEVTVTTDEGPREGTTLEGLAKLRAVFKENGTTTAGNSSQVSDGAAATLLMRRSKANELGLPILAVFRGFKVVGVPPLVMGIGPAFAIPALLEDTEVSIDNVDIYEINEAFASQAVYCVKKLNIPMSKVNPNGSGLSLGHPLGCTGSRQVATLVNEMKRTNSKLGVVSMCIGTGMGAASLFEAEN
jgi:acetyl-CoA acyltransferase 1